MKVFFLSGLYPKGSEQYYASKLKKGALANPSNVYQWGIIDGLLSNGIDLEICSFPFLPTFPGGYRELRSKEEALVVSGRVMGRAVSYMTIAGCKEFSIINSAKKYIRAWRENVKSDEVGVILIYSLYGPFLKAAIEEAAFQKNIKVCPIATDLFISSVDVLKEYPFFKKIQGYFEYRMIKEGLENADTFVLLARGMQKFIPKAIDNHVIVEGILACDYSRPRPKVSTIEKLLLYTGSLGIHTSVKELVDAFLLTSDPKFRLMICGSGYYESYIRQKAEIDNRILFKGSVSREQAVLFQKTATLLINPRLPSIPDTPYSFPSKTMEYLTSGTPMIGYRLCGIPDEYYEYFYIPEDDSIESLARLISTTLNKPQEELDARAAASWRFIVNNKNAKMQVNKIITHFEALFSKDNNQTEMHL